MATNFKTNGLAVETAYATYDYIKYTNLWTWGKNTTSQVLGDGTTTTRSSPVQVTTRASTTWTSISAGGGWRVDIGYGNIVGVTKEGLLGGWGNGGGVNLYGSSYGSTWSKITMGYAHTLAIKTDGTLWGWGNNRNGQLGAGNAGTYGGDDGPPDYNPVDIDQSYASPIQVGALTTWSLVSAGYFHTLAIKTDGTLWSWGRNATAEGSPPAGNGSGQLGLGDVVHRSSPVQVGALTAWSLISAGGYHSVAIKTNGTLWTWGNNANGQLGLGDIVHRSSPVQVGALTTWSKIICGGFHCLAIKTDGTLWSWGNNSYGQLGLGDIVHRSSPVQVGALTTWSSLGAGGFHTGAIKTDGTLSMWGRNVNAGGSGGGQLGDGTQTNRSSPVQIGTSTTWSLIVGGNYHTAALQIDRTP